MRSIKFRGKRVGGRGWAIGGSLLLPTTDNVTTRIIAWNGTRFEVVPETVGQFTGLTDKNGVEIYEGDVVLIHRLTYCVEYFEKISCFSICSERGRVASYPFVDYDVCEVIGIIHDNPELLK